MEERTRGELIDSASLGAHMAAKYGEREYNKCDGGDPRLPCIAGPMHSRSHALMECAMPELAHVPSSMT